MSQSSTEKMREDSSMDEDSGHDSVDSLHAPADDRERIAHLETAVSWIRQEVMMLQTFDKDILQELWKIRSGIHDIRDSQKQQIKLESKFLSSTSLDDSSSEPRSPTDSLRMSTELRDLSPSPEHLHLSTAQFSGGTLDMRAAPAHLKQERDEKLLEDFFGTDQVGKLNEFKKTLSVDQEPEVPNHSEGSDDWLRKPPPKLGPTILLNPKPVNHKPETAPKPVTVPKPVPKKESKAGTSKSEEPVSNVVSEMQALRLRLQETALQELAEIDKLFPSKMSRPGSAGQASRSQPGHTRQGSADLNPSFIGLSHHVRQYSLPVTVDPSGLVTDVHYSRQSPSETRSHNRHSPSETRSHNRQSPSETRSHNRQSSSSPRLLAGSKLHYDSNSLGRRSRDSSRSPTPPLQYGHVRQSSLGSVSVGSGTLSPPPMVSPYSQLHQSHLHVVKESLKPFATPPPTRVSRTDHPQHHSFRGTNAVNKPPVPPSARPTHTNTVPSQSMQRKMSGEYNAANRVQKGDAQGLQEIGYYARGSLPKSFGSSGASTHYSTAVVRGKKHKTGNSRSAEKGGTQQEQVLRNGYLGSTPPVCEPVVYDHLYPLGSSRLNDVDQPEIKTTLGTSAYPRASSHHHNGRKSPSPRPYPGMDVKAGSMPNAYQSGSHPKLELKTSAPEATVDANHSPAVCFEEIEPYMSTAEVKEQMKQFKYVPFSEKIKNSSRKSDKTNLQVTEKTWC